MRWTWVGRDSEIAAARTAVAAGRTVVFVGPTGVGKSKLLGELISGVGSARLPVISTLATEATRSIALSSFIHFLPAEPPTDPSQLLRAVLDQLSRRRGADGLLVTVDDAQHLDQSSLALLALLTEAPAVSMALTVNFDEDVPVGLRTVLDDDRVVRVPVGPLDRAQVAAVVSAALDPAAPELIDEVWRVSDGNPLIVREVLNQVAQRPAAVRPTTLSHDDLDSDRLGELVRTRLSGLPAHLRDAVDMVAVGAPVPFEVLEAAVSLDHLAALHDSHVVETSQAGSGVIVRAAHPLYGKVLAAHAGEARRRQAYGRLAQAAIAVPGVTDPLRVAQWQQWSGAPLDVATALRGARSAIARHDGAAAEDVLRPVAGQLNHDGLLVLGAALSQQGKAAEAEEVFSSLRVSGDIARVELASARSFNLAFGLGQVDAAAAVLHAAAGEVSDDAQRSRLDAERGVIAGLGGDFALALDASKATIDNPGATGPALVSAYVSRSLAESMLGQCDALTETVLRGLALADAHRAEVPHAHDQIQIMQTSAAVAAGRLDEARDLVGQHVDGGPVAETTAAAWLGSGVIVETTAGRLDRGLEYARRAVRATEVNDLFHLGGQVRAMMYLALGLRGEPVPAPELDQLRELNPEPRVAVWVERARSYAAAIDDPGRGAAIAGAGGLSALQGHHLNWGAMCLHDAVRLGQASAVVDTFDSLCDATDGAALIDTMAAHARALSEHATDALAAVADQFASYGADLLAAETWAQQAVIHAGRGESARAVRADAASRVWEARCQRPRTPALLLRRPMGLTARELQIAMDAARGLASADIASQYVISVRTVDNHLGRAYRRLGVGGRDELAAFLRRHVWPDSLPLRTGDRDGSGEQFGR